MKVFITGANGLLATNIIIELLNLQYHVKGLVRNIHNFRFFNHPNLELDEGDVNHPGSFDYILKDRDYVIHAAAVTRQNLLQS